MLIEASRNGHTDVVNLLLDWPQTVLSQNGAELTGNELSPATSQSHNTDVIAQPRVPMDGLANVVPPQDPNRTSNNQAGLPTLTISNQTGLPTLTSSNQTSLSTLTSSNQTGLSTLTSSNQAGLTTLTSTQYQAQAIVQQVQQNIQNAHQSKFFSSFGLK